MTAAILGPAPSIRQLRAMTWEMRAALHQSRMATLALRQTAGWVHPQLCKHGHAILTPNDPASQNHQKTYRSLYNPGYSQSAGICSRCGELRDGLVQDIRSCSWYSHWNLLLTACDEAIGRRLTGYECSLLWSCFRNDRSTGPLWNSVAMATGSGSAVVVAKSDLENVLMAENGVRASPEENEERRRYDSSEQAIRQYSADASRSAHERASRRRNTTAKARMATMVTVFRKPPEGRGGPVMTAECCCPEDVLEDEGCVCDASEGSETKATLHGTPFFAEPGQKQKRLVGVELEFNEQTDLTRWVRRWRGAVHADGSCGYEAVTTPMAGGHVRKCLTELTSDLRAEGTRANIDCGVHVHVDANDVRWSDMFRLVMVYARVEPLLYLIAGQQRVSNTYAKPCGAAFLRALFAAPDREGAKLALASAVAGEVRDRSTNVMRCRPQKKDVGRYKGMNLMPWLTGRRTNAPDTTIEFRIHRNSLDGERVAEWATLCANLVTYAVNATDKEVHEAMLVSPLRLLCDIISKSQRRWILKRVLGWRSVTTYRKDGQSDEAGSLKATRRISFKPSNGAKAVSLCAV